MNPPLRSASDVEAPGPRSPTARSTSWPPIMCRTRWRTRDCEWAAAAFGMLGLETAPDRAAHHGRRRAARLGRGRGTALGGPARIGRLAEHGRLLAVGEPAHVVLYDPTVRRVVDAAELASLSRNTPYAGMELPGRVVATSLHGRPTVLDGKLC
ncbi:MAG: hypothetical protein R2734_00515 [Nocardioides sp.]